MERIGKIDRILLVRKVKDSLNFGRTGKHSRTPLFDLAGQRAARIGDCCRALQFGFRGEKVCQAFGFCEIYATVREGATGKFALPSRAETFDHGQLIAHRDEDGAPSMTMKFGAILARSRARAWEPQDECFIKYVSVTASQTREAGLARFEPTRSEPTKRFLGTGPADPDDANRRRRRAARYRENRILVFGHE